jgi:hypothetical protein
MEHIKALRRFIGAGLSCAPVKIADKFPSMLKGWKKYQSELPTKNDIKQWASYYRDGEIFGACIICGKVSGGVVMLEIDNKDGGAAQLFEELANIEEVAAIIANCPIEKSKSGGYHFYFKMDEPCGNLKLAMVGKMAVIETRGEGGLVVCAPTKGYELMQGDLCDIPTITAEQAATLFDWCRSFDKPEIAPQPKPKAREKKIESEGDRPGDWYNKNHIDTAKQLLKQNGWTELQNGKHWRRPGKDSGVSATFGHIAEDVFYCFSSNGWALDSGRCYHPFDLLTVFNFNGDYSAAARWVVENYNLKPNRLPKKTEVIEVEGEEIPQKKTPPQTYNQPISKSNSFLTFEEFDIDENQPAFWYFGGKDGTKFCIDYYQLRIYLSNHGYYRYELAPNQWILVRIVDNVAEEIEFEQMREFIGQFLIKRGELDIFNHFFDSSKFSRATLTNIPVVKINWMRDTADECFIFFENGFTRTTATGTTMQEYKDMRGVIWASQKLTRRYSDDHALDFKASDVYRFAELVSDNDALRITAYMSALGYLLHNFKRETFCPAIIFADENDTDEPFGGTGKGMSTKFVGKMREVITVDGKNFKPGERFALQRVSQKTNVLLFDDLDKNADFEKLFSWLTDGLPVNKLYMGEIYLSFKDSPKFAITSNYPLKGTSSSYERRMFEIEIHRYFSTTHTPDDEFKKSFFHEWDPFDWLAFDVFMLECVRLFLEVGLKRPNYVTLRKNRLKVTTSPAFVEWAEKTLIPGKRYNKATYFDDFKKAAGDPWVQNKMAQNTFTKWVQSYCHYLGVDVNMRAGGGGAYMAISDLNGNCDAADLLEDIGTAGDIPF